MTQLGSFQIVDRLGAGAMGVVYRAQDSRLDRQVAIKVLPDALANDHERLGRFQREAKLLASLNHPNIAAIYEIGSADGSNFLVMELIEGLTLAELLKRGSLHPDKALPIFAQIADALEYAHEHNVIHRDLKPANVMVTDEGVVKVLDFGLAKALDEPTTSSGETATRGLDLAVATSEGHILGTPAYMAPEQASGKKLDRRVDIWAFGCCLYEALVGQRPFTGENATQLLARILEREPDWATLDDGIPARIRVLIWRCLQKDPRRRLRDIGEARFELSESTSGSADKLLSATATLGPTTSAKGRLVLWGAFGALIGTLATSVILLSVVFRKAPTSSPESSMMESNGPVVRAIHHVTIDQAERLHVLSNLGVLVPAIAMSPDGRRIAYVGEEGENRQLYLIDRVNFEGSPLPGTSGATMPFFSPDGKSIAFFTQNELKTVSVGGGSSRPLCDARNGAGGCWAEDGTIYFAEEEGQRVSSVSAEGGKKKELLERSYPVVGLQLLPDNHGLLAIGPFDAGQPCSTDYARIIHLPFDSEGLLEQPQGFLTHGYAVRYVRSGHVVFMRGDSLWAAEIDLQKMRVIGRTQHLVGEVMAKQFAISANGDLAYVPGRDNWKCSPSWIDRENEIHALPFEPDEYGTFDLSDDNDQLAIQVNGVDSQVAVYSIDSGNSWRLTETGASANPVWTRDANSLAFSWIHNGSCTIALKQIRSSRPPRSLVPPVVDGFVAPFSSTDGDELAYVASSPLDGTMDIRTVSIATGHEPREFLATNFNEWSPAFSPNGRWIAYTSDQDGQYQVYVRPYPETNEGGTFWQVSEELGEEPIWSPAGGELFYRNGNRIMSVSYDSSGEEFSPGKPEVAVETRFVNIPFLSYDVSKDGQRFLILRPAFDDTKLTEIRIVQNWIMRNEL